VLREGAGVVNPVPQGGTGMKLSFWRAAVLVLLFSGCLGCLAPPGPQAPPLTPAAAKNTLDSWNPSFCKVKEFYGFYQPAPRSERVAYVLVDNPSQSGDKPKVCAARFRLLTLADGQQRWFLTSLVTHSAGLTRRQGWDNLMVPVKPPAAAK
jgi:hypothetical protein